MVIKHFFMRRVLGVRKACARVDLYLRRAMDRVLPRNLSARYVVALTTVAGIAISGQMVIQYSLQRQIEMGRRIRHLENLVFLSERLRKTVLELRLSSNRAEMEDLIDSSQTIARQIDAGHRQLKSESIDLLGPLIASTNQLSATADDFQLSAVAKTLLSNEISYRQSIEALVSWYEQELLIDIANFKNIELVLLCLTLLVLALEGLYVFRPAVENLYEALRVRSDFLSRMSHEVRNPMNSIMGMSNLLAETPLNEQQKKYLSILRKSGSSLLDVLNNLLDFSTIESGKLKLEMRRFNLKELLEKCLDFVAYGAHTNRLKLSFELDPRVPVEVEGDPLRLQQVLSNLLGNAVKFTTRGRVTLKVDLAMDQIYADSSSISVRFSVVDTGIGMDADQMSRIFDPFMQGDSSIRRRYGGTGLGLSISHELVRLMGGGLSVESQKHVGSRFWFEIPLRTVDARAVKPVAPAPVEKRLRILVADDSVENQFLIQAYLESCPFSLVFANDGREALERYKKMAFDLVLMDLQMPEMDGHSAALAIREYERTHNLMPVPIIAVSAHEPRKVLEKVENGVFQTSLVKPVDPVELRKVIQSMHEEFAEKVVERQQPKQEVQAYQDPQAAIERVKQKIAGLAPTYLRNREQELVNLKQWLAAGDFKRISMIGHRLKGNAVSYGFPELSRIGALLEDAAREERLQESSELVAMIEQFLVKTQTGQGQPNQTEGATAQV